MDGLSFNKLLINFKFFIHILNIFDSLVKSSNVLCALSYTETAHAHKINQKMQKWSQSMIVA